MPQVNFTREGKNYTAHIDTAAGQSTLYVEQEERDAETGNKVRYYPHKLEINFDAGTGAVAYIFTTWRRGLVGDNGTVIWETAIQPQAQRPMETNKADQATFIGAFGYPILMSMTNGFVRAVLGHNALPLFNPAAGPVPLAYTPEQEAQAPTYDYHPLPVLEDENTVNP